MPEQPAAFERRGVLKTIPVDSEERALTHYGTEPCALNEVGVNVETTGQNATCAEFSEDGQYIFYLNGSNLIRDELSEPFAINEVVDTVTNGIGAQQAFTFTEGGSTLLACDSGTETADRLEKYSLDSPYDISNLTFEQDNTNVSGSLDVAMRPDGGRLWLTRQPSDNFHEEILQYNLGTAFDLSTMSINSTIDVSDYFGGDEVDVFGFDWFNNGNNFVFSTGLGEFPAADQGVYEVNPSGTYDLSSFDDIINNPDGMDYGGVRVQGDCSVIMTVTAGSGGSQKSFLYR